MEMLPRLVRLLFIGSVTAIAVLTFWPYHDAAFRFGMLSALAVLWLVCLWWGGKTKWRWLLSGLPVLVAIPFALPARPLDRNELCHDYLAALKRYEGIRYLWGGEGRSGIDCSGLPRRALRDALLQQAWRHGNGAAVRMWADQWWHDASAKALGEGYRGMTRPLGVDGTVRTLDSKKLLRGDLAITRDGRHVMVCFGETYWIQADPGAGGVAILDPATSDNPWFDAPVAMHRWAILEK